MKCECLRCYGTGEVKCIECDGQGTVTASIEVTQFDRDHPNYDELLELQKDAQRLRRQCYGLKTLKPNRSDIYEEQLQAALNTVNSQADALQGEEKGTQHRQRRRAKTP